MRRLRTTLQTYSAVLKLPKNAAEKHIKKLAKVLGYVRDLDVLMQKLQQDYRPQLSKPEQKKLDTVLNHLQTQRQKKFSKLNKTLNGNRYRTVTQAYQQWLNQPEFDQTVAICPINLVLPDLLMPLVSDVFLHRGWFVGAHLSSETISIESLNQWLDQEGTVLHDLRKQMKRVRYQADFLADFYGESLSPFIPLFKEVQDVLGQLQDCWVLNQVMAEEVNDAWAQSMPELAALLRQERFDLWRAWQPLRQRFVNPEFRDNVRQTIVAMEHLRADPPVSSPNGNHQN